MKGDTLEDLSVILVEELGKMFLHPWNEMACIESIDVAVAIGERTSLCFRLFIWA